MNRFSENLSFVVATQSQAHLIPVGCQMEEIGGPEIVQEVPAGHFCPFEEKTFEHEINCTNCGHMTKKIQISTSQYGEFRLCSSCVGKIINAGNANDSKVCATSNSRFACTKSPEHCAMPDY